MRHVIKTVFVCLAACAFACVAAAEPIKIGIVHNSAQAPFYLALDKGYQDIEFYTEFRCAEKCDAGVLLRAEKTPDGGWKGVYVSLDGDPGPYDITLNAEGKELTRTRMPRAAAQFARMAAGPWTNGQTQVPGFAKPAITLAEQQEEASKPATPAAPAAPAGRGGAGGRGGFAPPREATSRRCRGRDESRGRERQGRSLPLARRHR